MPWNTPDLKTVRGLVRDSIRGNLPGADASIPNSVLRVMSDSQGALCHLTMQYIDWLAKQLLPDTAETEWLDRHGNIWLVNADGTTGRKLPTLATGTVSLTGTPLTVVPKSTVLSSPSVGIDYETTETVTLSYTAVQVPVRALDPGIIGNNPGATLNVITPVAGLDGTATVIVIEGGTDTETDDELRARVLLRIREPPMGGDAKDYVQWALAVPGVTRAWCAPLEMGMGTVTVRFMMDDLRASNGGFPLPQDIAAVTDYLDTVRPVAVKDFFVVSPIPHPIDMRIKWLDSDTPATRAAITASLLNEFMERTAPGQTWYRSWLDEGILAAAGVNAYDLEADDVPMPSLGDLPILGDIRYG
jgi:uncharacterized phage protein gp47/JayE